LADNYGYLGIDFSDEVSQSNLVLAGYPTDTNGALHMYQGKVKYFQNQLIHTMNTNKGLGGSPII
jgi:V8-like Glu-specific endopeptidase